MKMLVSGVAAITFLATLSTSFAVKAKKPKSSSLPHVDGYFPIAAQADDMGTHQVAFWRQKQDTYVKHSYKDPKTGQPRFNSCMNKDISAQDVCHGRGICAPFDRDAVMPVFFCKCDFGWAGTDCTLKQKSQATSWLLSLFFGWFGADRYYLGLMPGCALKVLLLFTSGMIYAVGFNHIASIIVLSYWLYDIMCMGSGPMSTYDAKVAADLPHWAFACFTLVYFAFLAFIAGIAKIYFRVKEKRCFADMEKNYSACDKYGAPIDVRSPVGNNFISYSSLPKYQFQ